MLVTVTLVPEGTRTRLRFVETEIEDMGWPPDEQFTHVPERHRGWATYLRRLDGHLRRARGRADD